MVRRQLAAAKSSKSSGKFWNDNFSENLQP